MIYPRADLFDLCTINDATFWPLHRQELSRTSGGTTQAKDLGSPLWKASFTTAPARLGDAADIEAALISLRGSSRSFLAHDVRRPFPRLHADGGFTDAAVIDQLFASDAFLLGLSGMPSGFTLSPGDYLAFEYGSRPSRALHMVTNGGVFGALGRATVEVFPAIRPGALEGAAVTLKKASCEMILEPGQSAPSLRDMVTSAVTFSAIQLP